MVNITIANGDYSVSNCMFFWCADLSEACLTSKTSRVVKVCDSKESRFSSSHSPPHSTADLGSILPGKRPENSAGVFPFIIH